MAVITILIKINMMKYFFLLPLFLFLSCDDEGIKDSEFCDDAICINESDYESAQSERLTILNVTIDEDFCLLVEYQSGGCNGDSWKLDLIDSGGVAESDPEQRFARFDFENNEECEALITKTTSFDISDILLEGRSFILNLQAGEWSDSILIEEN